MDALPWDGTGGPIADRVAGSLARRIVDGEIEPGEVLTEVDIAASVGASRTPVREAMLRLDGWGLVRLAPKKGAVVTNPTARERRELLAVRAMLENSAVAAVARDDDARRLLLEELDVNLAAQAQAVDDPRAFAPLDYAFHALIIGHDDNRVVAEISRSLGPRLYRLTRLAVDSGEPARFLDEHARLAETIRAADAEGFGELVARHLEEGHARYEVTG